MVMAAARRDPPDRPLMRVSWFCDAGYHVEVDGIEVYNLDAWADVRRWLGSRGKPTLSDSRNVLKRLYDSEINGCIAEHAGGDYVVALGDECNRFLALGQAESWNGALQWLEEQARVFYPQSLFATHVSP